MRHRRNDDRLLKRTVTTLEKTIKSQGLDTEGLKRAEGSKLGQIPGRGGELYCEARTALEDRLERWVCWLICGDNWVYCGGM